MKRTILLAVALAVLGSTLGATANAGHLQTKSPPLIGGFYNGTTVTYLLTDASTKKDAAGLSKATKFPVVFAPRIGKIPDGSLAKLYLFTNGVKGPNPFGFQANIVDSIPGQAKYSPLWRVYAVTWEDGGTPRLLTSEAAVLKAQRAGELTVKRTGLVKNSPVVPS